MGAPSLDVCATEAASSDLSQASYLVYGRIEATCTAVLAFELLQLSCFGLRHLRPLVGPSDLNGDHCKCRLQL